MRFEALKVGELALRTGSTVRALHHYDEIGLLRPSLYTEAGHRLSTGGDTEAVGSGAELRLAGARSAAQQGLRVGSGGERGVGAEQRHRQAAEATRRPPC